MAQRRNWQQWRELVEGWQRSGLTQREYCERHGISVASLVRWRDILRRQRSDKQTDSGQALQLLPVQLVEAGNAVRTLTLVLNDGLRIELPDDFNVSVLQRLLGVLREAA